MSIRDIGRQVGFRCSEAFYNRLDLETKRRGLSIQDTLILACEQLFAAGPVLPLPAPRNVTRFWATPEEEELVEALFVAAQTLPPERLEMLRQQLVLDSQAYAKAASRSQRFAGRYGSRFEK